MTDSIKGSFYEYIQRENEYFEQEIKELKSDNKHLNDLLDNALNEVETLRETVEKLNKDIEILRSENAYLKQHIKQASKGVNYAR